MAYLAHNLKMQVIKTNNSSDRKIKCKYLALYFVHVQWLERKLAMGHSPMNFEKWPIKVYIDC